MCSKYRYISGIYWIFIDKLQHNAQNKSARTERNSHAFVGPDCKKYIFNYGIVATQSDCSYKCCIYICK